MSKGERVLNPISKQELERRWAAVRDQMGTAGLDALVVQGFGNMMGGGGYFRWLTGMVAPTTKPQTVIFPARGLMTLVTHGNFNEEKKFDGTAAELPGVGCQLGTPSFAAVSYTCGYEPELIGREIKKSGYRTVGLVGEDSMYFGFGKRLQQVADGVTYVDATELLDPFRAIKSPEEIALVRRSAAMQDEIMEKIRGHIRPGMKDFEVMCYGQYLGQMLGSENGYFLGSSAPPGEPASIRQRNQQGRTIHEGDILYFQCENGGPGGQFTHLGRFFVLGKAPQYLTDAFGAMLEAQSFTLKLLQPGAKCAEIFAEYNVYMRGKGLQEEGRIHCHGQGYDYVERPLVRSDESMTIAANMNLGLHPAHSNQKMFVTVCDNFLTHADGSIERLHRTPLEIVEL